MQGMGFQSLIGEPRSHIASQCSQKIKKQKVHIKLSKHRPLAFEHRRAQGGGVRRVELAL